MPNIALLPPEQWEALKLANVRGVEDAVLAEQFDVTREAIRQRRSRDPAWAAAMADRKHHSVQRANKPEDASSLSQLPSQNVTKVDSGLVRASVTANLAEIHAQTATKLAQATASALGTFAQKPAPVESWQDAKTAYSIQRLACGVDKEGVQVNVTLGMFGGEVEEGPAWEAEVVETGGEVDQLPDG